MQPACTKGNSIANEQNHTHESSGISETGEVTPTKIGVHACYINTYLQDFFEPIPID